MILTFPHRGLARGRGTLTTDGRYVIPCAVKDGRVWCRHIVDGEVRFDWLPADAVFLGKRAASPVPQPAAPRGEATFFTADHRPQQIADAFKAFADAMAGDWRDAPSDTNPEPPRTP